MAVAVTLVSLIARVRAAADLEGSNGPVSDSEIGAQLVLSIRRLYERLLLARGQEYYRKTAELNVTPGTAIYSLPADFFELLAVLGCDTAVMSAPSSTFAASDSGNSGSWCRLAPFSMAELERLLGASRRSGGLPGDPHRPKYRTRGAQANRVGETVTAGSEEIELRPAPVSVWTLRIEYIPSAVDPSGGAEINGIHGWEEVAVLEVAAYCLAKQEQDTRYLKARVAEEYARIDSLARARDAGSPEPGVVDTCGLIDGWGGSSRAYGHGYGGGWLS